MNNILVSKCETRRKKKRKWREMLTTSNLEKIKKSLPITFKRLQLHENFKGLAPIMISIPHKTHIMFDFTWLTDDTVIAPQYSSFENTILAP